MSISSALHAGVSGLIANSSALAAISDNIANVNTVGYKRADTQFQDLVTTNSGLTGIYTAGGVNAVTRQLVTQQSDFQATNSPTDLAISGQGLFVVTTDPDRSLGHDAARVHPRGLLHARQERLPAERRRLLPAGVGGGRERHDHHRPVGHHQAADRQRQQPGGRGRRHDRGQRQRQPQRRPDGQRGGQRRNLQRRLHHHEPGQLQRDVRNGHPARLHGAADGHGLAGRLARAGTAAAQELDPQPVELRTGVDARERGRDRRGPARRAGGHRRSLLHRIGTARPLDHNPASWPAARGRWRSAPRARRRGRAP